MTQRSTQYFTLATGPDGAPCPGAVRPFEPAFHAASSNHSPGAHASSRWSSRADGDQDLAGLTVATPPGFLAHSRSASPTAPRRPSPTRPISGPRALPSSKAPVCPAASQVGTSTVGAGAGSHPLYVPGKAYLAGPYKGAPLSLVVITPGRGGAL